jgi:hypothetical protein
MTSLPNKQANVLGGCTKILQRAISGIRTPAVPQVPAPPIAPAPTNAIPMAPKSAEDAFYRGFIKAALNSKQ